MVTRRRIHSLSRSGERGATLFIVVLAITLLTGIGLYTVHSAALLTRAAGNERQAMQAEHLAEIGTLSTLADLAVYPSSYIPLALSGADDCRMNLGLDTSKVNPPPCLEKSSSTFTLATGNTLFDEDSFGALVGGTSGTSTVGGRFVTEATDVAVALGPVEGMDAVSHDAFRYYQAKLTTIAQLEPAGVTAANACVQNVMQVAGQHMTRAHVLIGPYGGI